MTIESDCLIRVESIRRYFGEHCAVRDVSFSVQRGEVVGFLGPNGAGKTTTMQMITGVLAAHAGRITIAGHDLVEAPRRARSHVGYLPEQPPLYPDLSVDEYLRYAGRLRGLRGSDLDAAQTRCKQRCGLAATGRRLIGNLSKGYQQRVGIAQAIIHSPSLVILDEPTVGLDPIQIREIRNLIRELGTDHSVLLSTHILPEVQSVCDRVLIIHQGELVLNRRLSDLADDDDAAIIVALRTPPNLDALRQLQQIRSIVPLADNRFYIEHDGSSTHFAEEFAQFAVDRRWGLFELGSESDSLETLFIRLTGGDTTVPVTNADEAAA